MKKIFLYLATVLMAGCSSSIKTIEISNTGSFDRNDEIIQINDKEFLQLFEESDKWILKNNHNQEIGYQLVKNENGNLETFIFQAAVPANKKVAYHLKKGNPSPVEPKTFARFVPERKDDFAWENDLAAYRMYGPALAGENPSNGVDLWLTATKLGTHWGLAALLLFGTILFGLGIISTVTKFIMLGRFNRNSLYFTIR